MGETALYNASIKCLLRNVHLSELKISVAMRIRFKIDSNVLFLQVVVYRT